MRTTGARLVGIVTAGLLGLGLSAPPAVQAEAAGATARADAVKVTARAVSGSLSAIAPTADGRFVVAVNKSDQLVRYRVRPTRIREVGHTKSLNKLRHLHSGDVHVAVHPGGRFAYVGIQPWRKSQKYAVLVFNIDRTRPKLVRTISLKDVYPDKAVQVRSMAMRPDGKRLYLGVRGDLVTFDMGRGRAGELVSVESGQRVGWSNLAVTPDGTRLISGIAGNGSPDFVRYRTWDITSSAPVPGPEQRIDLTEIGFEDDTSLRKIVPARDNTTAYVQIESWVDDYADMLTARVDLTDGTIEATTGSPFGAYKFEELLGRSPSGRRVYGLNSGPGGGEADSRDPYLARTDGDLASYQRLEPGRFALDKAFAVSPAGKTKGLIYSTQKRNGKRYLVSIKN